MRTAITRRQFTKSAVLAGAAMTTARSAMAVSGANERIRVGVIGLRTRGPQVAGSFLKTGRYDIVTLCDCDQNMWDAGQKALDGRMPQKPKLEQDFRKVLEDSGVDAIINATPDHWHAYVCAAALDAGKHVYTEKPACYNIQDGHIMLAAQKRHPKQAVQVGTQQRSGRHFLDAKAFITEGGLGTVGFARGWFTTDRGTVDKVPDSQPPAGFDYDLWIGPAPMRPFNTAKTHYNWHFVRDLGTGDMGNWGAHWIDSIRHLLGIGVPTSVMAAGGTYVVHDAKEFPDTQTVLYEYPDMTVVWEMREWSPAALQGMDGGVEIRGSKGMLLIDRGGWSFQPHKGEIQKHKSADMEITHARNFADCIAGAAHPAAPLEEGVKTCTLLHLGNIATFTKRRLEWDDAAQTIKNDPEAAKLLGREYRAPWKMPPVA